MPAKRSLWAKGTINFNYLINTIHLWASRVIPLARASGTVVEKRDSANLSYTLTSQAHFVTESQWSGLNNEQQNIEGCVTKDGVASRNLF
jgi:hypothetical protein